MYPPTKQIIICALMLCLRHSAQGGKGSKGKQRLPSKTKQRVIADPLLATRPCLLSPNAAYSGGERVCILIEVGTRESDLCPKAY